MPYTSFPLPPVAASSAPEVPRGHARPSRLAVAARDAAYLVSGLPIGVLAFSLAVTGVALAAGLAITLLGIPVLVATLYAARGLGALEHRRAGWVLGAAAGARRPARRWGGGPWQVVKRSVSDPAPWRGLLWAVLTLPAGVAGFVVAVSAWSVVLGLLTSWTWTWALPEGQSDPAWLSDPGVAAAGLRIVLGLVLIPVAYWLCRLSARGLALAARAVIG